MPPALDLDPAPVSSSVENEVHDDFCKKIRTSDFGLLASVVNQSPIQNPKSRVSRPLPLSPRERVRVRAKQVTRPKVPSALCTLHSPLCTENTLHFAFSGPSGRSLHSALLRSTPTGSTNVAQGNALRPITANANALVIVDHKELFNSASYGSICSSVRCPSRSNTQFVSKSGTIASIPCGLVKGSPTERISAYRRLL